MSGVRSMAPPPVLRSRDHWTDLSRDWSRMADPSARAEAPFKVYLPRTTSEVVRAVREAEALGHPLVIRGGGHSSNDLATAPGAELLLTEGLDRVLDIDVGARTVTVQPGVGVMEVDRILAEHGLGLEIVPDHPGVTVGGYVSVGGLSAASLNAGLFVDTVTALEYVDLEGNVHRRSRADDREAFRRGLARLGSAGVITEVGIRVVEAHKDRTVLRNHRKWSRDPSAFLASAREVFANPGSAVFARANLLDLGSRRGLVLGTVSAFETSRRGRHRARASFALLRALGRLSSVAPGPLGVAAKKAAAGGLLVAPPKFATQSDVDRFSIGVVDWSVGDPCRFLVAFAPIESLEGVFAGMYGAALELRARTGELTSFSIQLKGIRSDFLAPGEPDQVYVEIMLVAGVKATPQAAGVLRELASAVDDVCLELGAYRYMHTLVSKHEPAELRRLDPAGRYAVQEDTAAAGVDAHVIQPGLAQA